jgi:hypothetical protein
MAVCALLIAGIVVGTLAALRLLFSGDGRMTFSLASSALLLAGFAVAVAATLALPNRFTAPRPATLALAAIVSAAWPISGHPVPAAAVAVVVIGLALACDIRFPGGRRVRGTLACQLLAACAGVLVVAGLALAETHRTDREPARAAARPLQPNGGTAAATDAAPGAGAATGTDPGAVTTPTDPAPTPGDSPATTPADPGPSPDDSLVATPEAPAEPDAKSDPAAGETPADPAPAPDLEAAPVAPAPKQDPTPAPDANTTPAPADPLTGPDAELPTEPSAPAQPDSTPSDAIPAKPDPPTAEDFVRGYYEQLDAQRFEEAWASLSPAVQASFGGFEHWRNGYSRTTSSTPSAFEVDGNSVTHLLTARDRGCPKRQFLVRWRLGPADGTWTVEALSASALDDVICS